MHEKFDACVFPLPNLCKISEHACQKICQMRHPISNDFHKTPKSKKDPQVPKCHVCNHSRCSNHRNSDALRSLCCTTSAADD